MASRMTMAGVTSARPDVVTLAWVMVRVTQLVIMPRAAGTVATAIVTLPNALRNSGTASATPSAIPLIMSMTEVTVKGQMSVPLGACSTSAPTECANQSAMWKPVPSTSATATIKRYSPGNVLLPAQIAR